MKKIFGTLAFAALLSIIPLSTASAMIISTHEGDWTGYTAMGAELMYDFDTLPDPVLTSSYQITNLTTSGTAAQPLYSTGNYLAIPNAGALNADPPLSSADLQFSKSMDYLGFLWGSIDKYNKIDFYNGADIVGTFTGTDVATDWVGLSGLAAYGFGNQTLPSTNLYVTFTGAVFDSIRLTSSQMAFEVDNISGRAVTPVPEPTVTMLFALGVAGFAGVSRRRLFKK